MNRLRLHCNSCDTETWHEVVAAHKQNRYYVIWGHSQDIEAEVLRCCGCDSLAFRLVTHSFEFQDENDRPEDRLFSDRNFTKRKRKFFPMPVNVARLYQETVTAHDAKLVLLSATGLRSLLEAVVVDKVDKSKYGRTLESKINALNALFEPGVLAVLHQFREMGNKAVHSRAESDYLDLHRALYVAESIMKYFYGLSDSADLFQRLKAKPKAKRKTAPKDGA